ncbi:MAG: hypothetical protein AAF389_01850 [Gemmatimonadota bacterium]
MYKSMLFLHWKQIKYALIPAVVASFGLPLMVVSGLGIRAARGTPLEAYQIIGELNTWLHWFPSLASALGILIGLSAWNWDHAHNHVYALSLPVSRFEYVLNKLLAGATLALIPFAGMWLGAHVASAAVDLPVGLNAYPNQLAVRFLFAMLLLYGLFFALASGTKATVLKLLTVVLVFVLLGSLGNEVLADYYPVFERVHMVEYALRTLIEAPGPFQVFSGNWALIDV